MIGLKNIFHLIILVPAMGFAQVYDDFDDGNFTENPPWNGDVQQFIVNSDFHLQLYSEGTGLSTLSTAFVMSGETEWRFWIRESFSPSANNNGRFYLSSDQSVLSGTVNGYFLQFGESGSGDAIELFRQQGDILTSVCRGTEGFISSSFQLNIRVRRDQQGNWKIETDETGSGAYQTQATGFDDTFNTSAFVGVYCKYTTSNAKKFYFDNVYAGPYQRDTDPPVLEQVTAYSDHQADVWFNEAVTANSASDPQNFFVDQNIGNPVTAQRDAVDLSIVHLEFDTPFPNGKMLTLTVNNITDLEGNISDEMTMGFSWFVPAAHEIQINEIMADPSPSVELPEYEYLELYNTTNVDVNLDNWTLTIGSSEKTLENVTINANGYLILADDAAQTSLSWYGDFYGFTSFALTNSGQTVILKNPDHAVISCVCYTRDWYHDPVKEDGGWSLEQIDPENPCGGINNWSASESPYGGTPGAPNSVSGTNPDHQAPQLWRVAVTNAVEIQLFFSEPMDSTGLDNTSAYTIDRGIGNPVAAIPVPPDYSSVMLTLSTGLETGLVYLISVSAEFYDCAGNLLDEGAPLQFGLPETPEQNDVVINELLYNPKNDAVTGVDYVEIYNRSGKIIDLHDLVLATENRESQQIESVKNISEEGFLMFPADYLLLTTRPDVVKAQYYTGNPDGFIGMTSLPAYGNEEGVVILATRSLRIIDRFVYNNDMQLPVLNTTDGVALERVNYDRPTNDPTNWHSAAETYGFGTPAYLNSVYSDAIQTNDPVTVEPEIFSPDNDGTDDLLNISYHFEEPGYIASITIFDSRGRKVRQLINNESLGTEGTFSWDGMTDDNRKSGIGIYIIYIEIFDLNGNVKKYKKTAVLAAKLQP